MLELSQQVRAALREGDRLKGEQALYELERAVESHLFQVRQQSLAVADANARAVQILDRQMELNRELENQNRELVRESATIEGARRDLETQSQSVADANVAAVLKLHESKLQLDELDGVRRELLRANRDLTGHTQSMEQEAMAMASSNVEAVLMVDEQEKSLDRLRQVVRDTDEQRKLEQELLRESEERYRALFDRSMDCIYLQDFDGRFLDANKAALTLFGYAGDEITALTLQALLSADQLPTARALFEEILTTGRQEGIVRFSVRTKDGSLRHIETKAALVYKGGKPVAIQTLARDVTERLLMEARLQQQQKLESIGTLASGVAHEINNPLTIVLGNAELIENKLGSCSETDLHRYAQTIVSASNGMAAIVHNLLSFARQDKEPHNAWSLSEIVEATLMMIGAVLRKDQIKYATEMEAGLPKVMCRSQQIQQVLLNLLTNARDALNERYPGRDPDKSILIKSFVMPMAGRQWVRTVVEDHGTGMTSQTIEKIFDPFFTMKPTGVGTGLGLSISYGIIKEHHGELSAASELGKFTRFFMDLPIQIDGDPQ